MSIGCILTDISTIYKNYEHCDNIFYFLTKKIYLENLTSISKLFLFLISIILITGISFVPALKSQASVQQTQAQPNNSSISEIVKQIADKVATANPGTNATFVEQILTELARQSALASTPDKQIEEIQQISSQVSTYPYGVVSQSLAGFANQLAADSTILLPTVEKIIQEKARGKSIPQSIVNIAIQQATGGGKNVNDQITLAAQIIAKQFPGIPVQAIESIIIQMALEISKAQGKAITGQTIFEVANQIKHNPTGVLTQAIIQLAKQDTHDNGKTGQTVNVIKKVVKASKEGGDKAVNGEQQQSNNKPTNPISSLVTPLAQPQDRLER